MSRLFSPLTLRGTTFRNRVWVARMCQYSSDMGYHSAARGPSADRPTCRTHPGRTGSAAVG